MGDAVETLGRRSEVLRLHLDELQRRLWLGVEAAQLGPGRVAVVAAVTGVATDTVRRGRAGVDFGAVSAPGRSVSPVGGRKRAEVHDGDLVAALEALVDPVTRGDPMSPLRWTCKSTRSLARALSEGGPPSQRLRCTGAAARGRLRPAGQRQDHRGLGHPDRDAQFGYLNAQAQQHLAVGDPVISVDTKKKNSSGRTKRRSGMVTGRATGTGRGSRLSRPCPG